MSKNTNNKLHSFLSVAMKRACHCMDNYIASGRILIRHVPVQDTAGHTKRKAVVETNPMRLRPLAAALLLALTGGITDAVPVLGIMAVAYVATGADTAQAAANALCSGSPSASCSGVTAEGISYTSGITAVNVGDGAAGTTAVNPGTIGIELSRTGVWGTSGAPDVTFKTMMKDVDNNPNTPDVEVVSKDGNPILIDDNYIIVTAYETNGDPKTFSIGTDNYSGQQLIDYLAANSPDPGGASTASLTVNNNAGTSSQGAPFSTTNAGGIVVSSTGGTGGSGHCFTILFWSWCGDAYAGGNAGSVAINSNATITVNGNGANGITAISQGGAGGNGRGWFGIFGSSSGGGGDGGNSAPVFVSLEPDSNITTHGDKSHGVYALSRGGTGGSGGTATALLAFGDNGGDGGNAGNVLVYNQGAILTTGWNSHGIYASSVGAGAGSGSSSNGAYAEGGNGGGKSSGAAVTVNNGGTIITQRDDSFGILVQSIGGGGGGGGGAGGWFTVGGKGGSGGGSGIVSVFDSGTVKTGTIVTNNDGTVENSGDRSTAILAQSIGGGGGNGGDAVSISSLVSVAVGGNGGLGGDGEEVHVIAAGSNIDTLGNSANGIQAQSIGGGGGNGGLAVAGALPSGSTLNVSIALGGKGGIGGNAGDLVSVETTAGTTIDTIGAASYGIMAQSIGGGGGNGGTSFAGSGGPGLSLAVSIGGAGGSAGSGKEVSIGNAGTITTTGDLSAGIFTQSIGGGGGNGGFAGSLAIGGTAVSVSLGGTGGDGRAGGEIDVVNSGTIATGGESAAGIFAQSIGGGGGNGGSAFAGSIGVASVSTTIGGGGGLGNNGGLVDIQNTGLITTQGNNSAGIFAQSVGGGGGSGGDATSLALAGPLAVGVAVGGSGGTGGIGGKALIKDDGTTEIVGVIVGNDGKIVTGGPNSDGVFAQSIGGSGGAGGSATTGTLVFPIEINGVKLPAIEANVAVGGRGAGGGTAGTVTVTNKGEIETTDFLSNGIFAQSVGGSGGKGGNASNIAISVDAMFKASVAVGGSGGQGGVGKTVTVDNDGLIHTQGAFSNGVLAQSVGGGGGTGGNATNVSLSLAAPPTSLDDLIPTPSAKVDIAVGGNGGNGAIGGDVVVSNHGTILTEGNFAVGVMAQSVGGSGGIGGDAHSIQVELTANPMDFLPLTSLTSLSMTMVFGGDGGTGSNGGIVTVTSTSNVTTTGAFAHGIVAQSVGGGGGSGGSAMTFEFSNANIVPDIPVLDDIFGLTTLEMTLQGSGGGGGNGGDVTLNSTGSVKTSGAFAMGVVAQSVAGGGGLAGFYNPQGITKNEIVNTIFNTFVDTEAGLSFAGSVGGAGNSGHVIANYVGTIGTLGDGAHGLFAQSVASQGVAGNVDITLNGSISASGKDANGIYAQSGGGGGNGDIKVTINSGLVSGGSGAGAGVKFLGGANNQLTNDGSIAALSGMAITGSEGYESVNNSGIITGSVDLGGGTNAFNNNTAATFNSGAMVQLGSGNLLTNEGTVSPGGSALTLTTSLTGNLLQTASGVYVVNIDHATATDTADRINVSGSANVAGQVQVLNLNAGYATPGARQVIIMSGEGGVTNSGLSLMAPLSAVISYQLLFDPTQVALGYGIDFAPAGMNANQTTIGRYINKIQLAGSSPSLTPVVAALLDKHDVRSLAHVYDHLSPEPYLGIRTGPLFSNLGFSDAMHSCGVRNGSNRFIREGQCGWLQFAYNELQQEGSASFMGFNRQSSSLSGGLQRAIGDGSWHAGFGLSYEHSTLNLDRFASTSGDQGQVGAILKKEFGATILATDLSAGYAAYHTVRNVGSPAPTIAANSRQDVEFMAWHLRLAHAYEQKANWYIKPMLDLGVSHSWFPGFQENGAGGINLNVMSHNEISVNLTPALEIGGEASLSNGVLIRTYAKLGITQLLSGTSAGVTASFQGAPVDVAPFTIHGELDKTYANIEIGVNTMSLKGAIMRASYNGKFSDHMTSNAAMLKLSIPF
ncbi:MAG: hypothetical protein HOP04_03115 [Methylophilaceae bacterium]|nr:hypothetical protein [Methylophilaceae bacterium]